MLILVVCLAVVALIAFALYSASRGEGKTVSEADLGGMNMYDAYYGKSAYSYRSGLPCDECQRRGCIGAGQCRCKCHRAS